MVEIWVTVMGQCLFADCELIDFTHLSDSSVSADCPLQKHWVDSFISFNGSSISNTAIGPAMDKSLDLPFILPRIMVRNLSPDTYYHVEFYSTF